MFLPNPLNATDTKNTGPLNRYAREVNTSLEQIQTELKRHNHIFTQTQKLLTDNDVPPNPSNVTGTNAGLIVDNVLYDSVTTQYTAPNPIQNFAGVFLVAKNYNGSSALVKVGEDTYHGAGGGIQNFKTILQRTNEVVTFYVVPKTKTEVTPTDWTTAPSFTLTLDGASTAPPAPTIASSLIGTTLGYQFSFNELSGVLSSIVQAYRIYRNTLNTISGATLIQTIPHDPMANGAIVVTDTIVLATGAANFYFVSAVNTSGQESAATPAQSGPIVGSIGSVPPSFSGAFTYVSTATSITWSWLSNQVIYRADNEATQIPAGTQAITGLTAGTTYYFYPYYDEAASALKWLDAAHVSFPSMTGVLLNGTTGYVRDTANETIGISHGFEFFVKTTAVTQQGLLDTSAPSIIGTFTAGTFQCVMNSTGTVSASVINTVPAVKTATSVAKINDGNWHQVAFVGNAAAATLTLYIDGVQDGQATAIGTISAASNIFIHAGAVHGRTSFPATANVFFNGTISHVSWYNEGANGALTAAMVAEHYQMAVNQGMLTLESAVDHDPNFAFMFWPLTDTSGTTAVDTHATRNGTYTGGVTLNQSSTFMVPKGTPGIAWPLQTFLASQAQNVRNVVALSSGAIPAATPASGSGGGTGGGSSGGGRGGCFSGNTLVKTPHGNVPIDSIQIGDLVLTAAGTWRPVVEVFQHDLHQSDPEEPGVSSRVPGRSAEGAWLMCDMGRGEFITVNQSLLNAGEWQRAYLLFGPPVSFFAPVFNLGIDARTQDAMSPLTENSFTLANGHVAHNVQLGK